MRRTRNLKLASLILVLSIVAVGQQTTKLAQPVAKTFSVNGKPIQTSLLQIDNRVYVALDDLASSLDGSVTTKATGINLAVPVGPGIQSGNKSNDSSGAGTLKGTLTYYFNQNYGTRPDVGAKVWIVSGEIVYIPDNVFVLDFNPSELKLINEKKEATSLPFIAQAVADGSGSVTLPNIPPGDYTVVMKSSHAKGGQGGGVNRRDLQGRVRTTPIKILAGQVIDISTDFGTSAY